MASCCQAYCDTAEQQFTEKKAANELDKYRRKGAGPTTRLLRDSLCRAGLVQGSLLDIGCGVGALTFELLQCGMTQATAIDASSAYLAKAKAEAEQRTLANRVRFLHADFLDAANDLHPANVVALDRVVCCFPFYERLLEQALRLAERGFAFSYPRDRWYVRAVVGAENVMRARKSAFRTFVHPTRRMEQVVREAGFELVSREETLAWTVDVFTKRLSRA